MVFLGLEVMAACLSLRIRTSELGEPLRHAQLKSELALNGASPFIP